MGIVSVDRRPLLLPAAPKLGESGPAAPKHGEGGRRLLLIACRVLWREFNCFSALSPHDVHIQYLEQGLHNTPERLRSTLQEAIDAAENRNAGGSPVLLANTGLQANAKSTGEPPAFQPLQAPSRFDAVLLGYGLCSNGIVGLRARTAPLVVPRAHDCITLLLGSKERYREYFDAHPGTYWYSPGWIENTAMPSPEHREMTYRMYCEKYGEENALYLMERMEDWYHKYDNVAYVDLGIHDGAAFRDFARRCASGLGWKFEEVRGEATLIRNLMNGLWNEDDFLVVESGGEIVADVNHSGLIRAGGSGSL